MTNQAFKFSIGIKGILDAYAPLQKIFYAAGKDVLFPKPDGYVGSYVEQIHGIGKHISDKTAKVVNLNAVLFICGFGVFFLVVVAVFRKVMGKAKRIPEEPSKKI